METYILKRVPNDLISEIIPEDTLNKRTIKGLPVFSVEQSRYYTKYCMKKGKSWYVRGTRYSQNIDPNTGKHYSRFIIMKDTDFYKWNNELLEELLAKERAIALKFIIFNEFYATVSVADLSNVIKILYYTLNM